MNLSNEELLNLYDETKIWCATRRKFFFLWSFDDLVHESYLISLEKLMPKYDYNRGPVAALLRTSLWSFVHRKYCKDTDVLVVRGYDNKTKKYGRRTYSREVFQWPDWDFDPPAEDPVDPPDLTGYNELSLDDQEVIRMRAGGMTMKQIGTYLGYSESNACQRFKTCKRRWEETRGR